MIGSSFPVLVPVNEDLRQLGPVGHLLPALGWATLVMREAACSRPDEVRRHRNGEEQKGR